MKPIDSIKIDILIEISKGLTAKLEKLKAIRLEGKQEIEGEGLTQATCEKAAKAYKRSERQALSIFKGLISLHQSDSEYIPDGMSEGNKEWPP